MKRLVIVGAGGTGEDAAEIIRAINQNRTIYEPVGFLDDDPAKKGRVIGGLPVHGTLASASEYSDAWFVDCLGSPSSFRERRASIDAMGIPDDRFETLIHPSAEIADSSVLAPGCVIYPFVYIFASAAIGRGRDASIYTMRGS